MKFLKFLVMALVVTFSLTFAIFAESPVSQDNTQSVSFTKAEKVTVATAVAIVTDKTVFDENIGANYLPVAKFISSGTKTNLNQNLSSQNRHIYLNDVNPESPPDNSEIRKTTKSRARQPPGFYWQCL